MYGIIYDIQSIQLLDFGTANRSLGIQSLDLQKGLCCTRLQFTSHRFACIVTLL
uniref:Uncharacterized protein n=1 Tax=Physcomitrium patens TaxID=3218 RepID=A0A2K1KC44_PHYPA|nr:hypothetical protein PHYPA_010529 [Physcomitrium patens]